VQISNISFIRQGLNFATGAILHRHATGTVCTVY